MLDLGDLVSCPDNGVASVVLDVLDILVLPLGALPDLDLAATTDDTYPHSREQVVRGIGVQVHATVEHGGNVLAKTALDEGPASRVLVDEVGDIMNNTSDSDETTAIANLFNIVVPFDNGELVERDTPVELGALLVKLFLELLDAALFDFVGTELLQIVGKTKLAPEPDAPLGRVVLVPLNGVAVVGWKLVVEIVVSLAEGNKCSNDVVPGAVAVVEGLIAEPVGERVDTESGLLDEEDAEDTAIDETSHPVAPSKTSHEGRED